MVVSYNVRQLLATCLDSVYRQQMSHSFDVWVVDNASSDGSPEMVRKRFPQVQLIANEENAGFAPANDQAIEASRGRYILILNPDTEILSGSLDRMISYLDSHDEVGLLGVHLVYADGAFQHSCFRFPGLAQAFLDLWPVGRLMERSVNGRYPRAAYEREMDVDHVLGACFMLRRSTGLMFDPAYFMYVEEIDLCWRLWRAGWKVRYLPELTVLHHAGASTRQTAPAMKAQLFKSRRIFNRRYRGPVFNAAWETMVRLARAEPAQALATADGGSAGADHAAAAHTPS